MENVWVALTGDHGIGPTLPQAEAAGMAATQFNTPKVNAALDAALNAKYSPGKNLKYILPNVQPSITLDPRPFQAANVSEAEAERAVAELAPAAFESSMPAAKQGAVKLPTRAVVRHAYTKTQIAAGEVPATAEGQRVLNSYSDYGGWYVLISVEMYEEASATETNHYTPYSYDRHVPLAFFGAPFVVGTYHQLVAPVDIAVTFASLLRVNRPTVATGNVLTFALKPGQ